MFEIIVKVIICDYDLNIVYGFNVVSVVVLMIVIGVVVIGFLVLVFNIVEWWGLVVDLFWSNKLFWL